MAERMGKLMQDSTLADVHIDVPFYSQKNKHVWDNKAAKAQHAVMKAEFNSLSPEARTVYRKVRDSYADQKRDMRDAARDHQARSYNLNKILTPDQYKELMEANTVEAIKALDLTALQDLEESFRDSLTTIVGATLIKGPYFPLRRFGDYVVEGETEIVTSESNPPEVVKND